MNDRRPLEIEDFFSHRLSEIGDCISRVSPWVVVVIIMPFGPHFDRRMKLASRVIIIIAAILYYHLSAIRYNRIFVEEYSPRDTWNTFLILVYGPPTVLLLLVLVARFLNNRRKAAKWSKLSKGILLEVRNKRHECLEKAKGRENDVNLEEEDWKICTKTVKELQLSMRKGEFTCERCLMAFIRRTRRLGLKECNAVTEELYDSAVSKARELDKSGILKKHPRADQPLLGIPISIKDSHFQKGCLSTSGTTKFGLPEYRVEKDGLLTSLLRASGAIPFVRTNVPQMLFMSETENYLWGRTTNPWNHLRTPGGSSGGEGALLALRASPLGCGSDIGGSIRIPSHFCGVVGFKPSPDRLTRLGDKSRRLQQDTFCYIPDTKPRPVSGPMANSVADCEVFMRAVLGPKMWEDDPHVCPIPWNATLAQRGPGRRLKIAYFVSDGYFEPCRAVSRAVHEAVHALEIAGHEVVPFTPPHTGWDVLRMYIRSINRSDMMATLKAALDGERLMTQYMTLRMFSSIPNCMRPMLVFLLRQIGQYHAAHLVEFVQNGHSTIAADNTTKSEIAKLQLDMHKEMKESNVDVLLFPTFPLPAIEHTATRFLSTAFSYCFLANLLCWPSGSVPITVVAENEQEYLHPNELPHLQRSSIIGRIAHWQMKDSAGLPCGVQIMAGPYKDEICLFAMAELEREIWKSKPLHYMVPPSLKENMKKCK